MNPTVSIGLPRLTDADVERLAEECESETSKFLLEKVPRKSVSDLSVVCMMELSPDRTQLDMDIQVDISQSYDTGHSLDLLVDEATKHASVWLERRLEEMKGD
jgi:hypothetical protein